MVLVRSITLGGAGVALASLATLASAHIAHWHPSMFGFNVTAQTFSYDNRPVIPLMNMAFQQWWFHGFLDYPPNAGDFFELPAGGTATTQLACDKGATDYFASSQGGDIRQGNWPCPGQPSTQFHTNSISDVAGCALAITYKSNQYDVQPEDFAVFSTNPTCVWNRYTDFEVPAAMPACPEEGCICSWFWIHSPDSGSEQNYMSPFRCKVTGATGTAPVAQAQLPRRCGADPANGRPNATPSNCTVGAKQPFYWFQKERNMLEGTYSPPLYNKLYGYEGGAENSIFDGSGSQPAQAASSAPAQIASSSSSVKTSSTLQATSSAVVEEAKPTSVASAQSEVHMSSSAPQAHSTSVAEAHSTSISVAEAHSTSAAEAHSSTVTEAHSSSAIEAHSSSAVEAHSSSAVEAHSTTASHSASTASSATASTASATSTRRCKSRKSKRSALEASADTKRAISPHARHHNLGRYVHDSTLH